MPLAEEGAGPLVILCHGWPESWYSWRHQIPALAQAGYHVVAPDQRGYGQTDGPQAIEAYHILHLTADIVGLVHALGEEQAVIVGHDWGSAVAWNAFLSRAQINQPSLFIAGENDTVVRDMYTGPFNSLNETMPGLTKKVLLPGAGHWIQQERAAEVTDLMLDFLRQTHS
jgi:pimeloyl-ACP methyl ester carboxylesterase